MAEGAYQGVGMDPVTIGAVLLAIVGGAGGELGSRLWDGVSALVRRPFRHGQAAATSATAVAVPPQDGEAELAALKQSPADKGRAEALARVLLARADTDPEFRQGLEGWWEQAGPIRTGEGNVTNTIIGSTTYGQVLQGRDFNGPITFGAPSAAPPPVSPPNDQRA